MSDTLEAPFVLPTSDSVPLSKPNVSTDALYLLASAYSHTQHTLPGGTFASLLSSMGLTILLVDGGFLALSHPTLDSLFSSNSILFWKLFKKTQWIRSEDADLLSGKAELDTVEWPQRKPRNCVQAMWLRFI